MSEQVTYPEIVPVLTDERVCYELRAEPGDSGADYRWRPVPKVGDLLAAVVSPLDYLALRPIRKMDDAEAVNDAVLTAANVEVFYRGKPIGSFGKIPMQHQFSLGAVVLSMSAVGSDPFFGAPAGSPR